MFTRPDEFESCGPKWFINGYCDHGHRYAKVIYCGHEYCTVCGEWWSASHQRRFSRWLPKVQQMESVGVFVFTIPMEQRINYRTKESLSGLGRKVQKIMKDEGFARGLRRWHFFGDKSNVYNPHLNVMVDGKFLDAKMINRIKDRYRELLGSSKVNIYYSFSSEIPGIVHQLKYILRSTFIDVSWDMDLAREFVGFRNNVAWGLKLWGGESLWDSIDESGDSRVDSVALNKIADSCCCEPGCGCGLTWGGLDKAVLLRNGEISCKRDYGGGYYLLSPSVFNGRRYPNNFKDFINIFDT